MAVTIQSGIREVTSTYEDSSIFRGVQRIDGAYAQDYTIFTTGYGYFVFLRGPKFVTTLVEDKWKAFKNLIEKGAKSFSGLNNITLDTAKVSGGKAGNEFDVATNAKDNFDGFQIKVYEYQGSPIRELLEFWLSGIRDFHTGFATYKGLAGNGLEYAIENHVASGFYITTDPTGKKVEYAAYITNIMPKTIPMDHLNWESSSHDTVEVTLDFTGKKYDGPKVNSFASLILDTIDEVKNYYDEDFSDTIVVPSKK